MYKACTSINRVRGFLVEEETMVMQQQPPPICVRTKYGLLQYVTERQDNVPVYSVGKASLPLLLPYQLAPPVCRQSSATCSMSPRQGNVTKYFVGKDSGKLSLSPSGPPLKVL